MQVPGLRKLWVTVAGSPRPSVWVVLRPTGQPNAAEIRATRAADPKNARTTAVSDIHFEFLNVKPGTYELMLEDQVAARGRGRGAIVSPKAVPVVVGDKDILDLTLNVR